MPTQKHTIYLIEVDRITINTEIRIIEYGSVRIQQAYLLPLNTDSGRSKIFITKQIYFRLKYVLHLIRICVGAYV